MLKRRMISLLMALAMACGACVAVSANEAQELDMSKAVITLSLIHIFAGSLCQRRDGSELWGGAAILRRLWDDALRHGAKPRV